LAQLEPVRTVCKPANKPFRFRPFFRVDRNRAGESRSLSPSRLNGRVTGKKQPFANDLTVIGQSDQWADEKSGSNKMAGYHSQNLA
jgi:hypothetical protein